MLIERWSGNGKKLRLFDESFDVVIRFKKRYCCRTFPVPYDIRFRWAIEKFSKIRLRRDVIFSFEDLVGNVISVTCYGTTVVLGNDSDSIWCLFSVSFGGTAAFFLGCSMLSFVEIIYFFSLRLIWYIVSRFQNKNK